MTNTSTPNDVLKAQSGELPAEEKVFLENQIPESAELEAFQDSAAALETELNELLEEPGEKPLQNIMAFVKKDLEARKKS
jgi:hypothetical protein